MWLPRGGAQSPASLLESSSGDDVQPRSAPSKPDRNGAYPALTHGRSGRPGDPLQPLELNSFISRFSVSDAVSLSFPACAGDKTLMINAAAMPVVQTCERPCIDPSAEVD